MSSIHPLGIMTVCKNNSITIQTIVVEIILQSGPKRWTHLESQITSITKMFMSISRFYYCYYYYFLFVAVAVIVVVKIGLFKASSRSQNKQTQEMTTYVETLWLP